MYINRITKKVKPGALGEVVKMAKAEIERMGSKATVYTPYFGPNDVAVFDFEFESLEAFRKWWDEYYATPEADRFMEKFSTLIETGGSNEFWNVE
jgi:glycogen synthase